jgi:hypothetical protein
MFMSGWYWRSSFWSRKPNPTAEKPQQKNFLGAGDDGKALEFVIPVDEDQEEIVQLKLEKKGNFESK